MASYEAIKTWLIDAGQQSIATVAARRVVMQRLEWLRVQLAVSDMHFVPLVLFILTAVCYAGVLCYVVACRWFVAR
jgi:hypothetical protein